MFIKNNFKAYGGVYCVNYFFFSLDNKTRICTTNSPEKTEKLKTEKSDNHKTISKT